MHRLFNTLVNADFRLGVLQINMYGFQDQHIDPEYVIVVAAISLGSQLVILSSSAAFSCPEGQVLCVLVLQTSLKHFITFICNFIFHKLEKIN